MSYFGVVQIGTLKKRAIGGTLGYRNKKTRWFKLEAGELRYYNSSEFRPSDLKNVIKLVGCSVVTDPTAREAFTIVLPDQRTLDVRVGQLEEFPLSIVALNDKRDLLLVCGYFSAGGCDHA